MTETLFILAAACAVLVALGFVVGPLLIGRATRPHALVIVFLIALIPAVTWLTYQVVGTPEGINPEPNNAHEVREVLADLAGRVERDPDNPEHWARLGMAYKDIEEFGSAEHAFRRALYVDEENDFLRVELAETLLYASERRQIPEEGRRLLNEAVEANPRNQKGMWLLGIDAFQRGEFTRSAEWFERLNATLPADAPVRATVEEYLARARQHGAVPAAADSGNTAPAEPAGTAPTMDIAVTIEPELESRLSGGEAVFIIVRPAGGSSVPLAVRRATASEIPGRFELDERHAMMDPAQLANAGEIVIAVRISQSGNARAEPGDFEGQSEVLQVGERIGAEVHIDRVL